MKIYANLPSHLFNPDVRMNILADAHVDRMPPELQPVGIADIGCGDGRVLDVMVEFILTTTARSGL